MTFHDVSHDRGNELQKTAAAAVFPVLSVLSLCDLRKRRALTNSPGGVYAGVLVNLFECHPELVRQSGGCLELMALN